MRSGDNGLSPFDRRHKFVASVVYNTNFTEFERQQSGRRFLTDGRLHQSSTCFQDSATLAVTNSFHVTSQLFSAPARPAALMVRMVRFVLLDLPNNASTRRRSSTSILRISRRFTIKEDAKIELLG